MNCFFKSESFIHKNIKSSRVKADFVFALLPHSIHTTPRLLTYSSSHTFSVCRCNIQGKSSRICYGTVETCGLCAACAQTAASAASSSASSQRAAPPAANCGISFSFLFFPSYSQDEYTGLSVVPLVYAEHVRALSVFSLSSQARGRCIHRGI